MSRQNNQEKSTKKQSLNEEAFKIFEVLTNSENGLEPSLAITYSLPLLNTSRIEIYTFDVIETNYESNYYKNKIKSFLEDEINQEKIKFNDVEKSHPTFWQANIPGKNYFSTPFVLFDALALGIVAIPFSVPLNHRLEFAAGVYAFKQSFLGVSRLAFRSRKKEFSKEMFLWQELIGGLSEKEIKIYRPDEAVELYNKVLESDRSILKVDVDGFNSKLIDIYKRYANN